jgi:hypothetical protein
MSFYVYTNTKEELLEELRSFIFNLAEGLYTEQVIVCPDGSEIDRESILAFLGDTDPEDFEDPEKECEQLYNDYIRCCLEDKPDCRSEDIIDALCASFSEEPEAEA